MKKKSLFAKQAILQINPVKNEDGFGQNYGTTEIQEATFETAISATGFGKFNYLLLALSIPCGWASMMDSTSMSYVVPAAHCDLEMDLKQRGLLNAITYLGMITSALGWGFLADTLGRKKILIAGYLTDAIFVTLAGLAQTYEMLLIAKFFTGFIINGPFAALTSVISEFHCAKYRSKVLMLLAFVYSLAQLFIPALAWMVIPREWDFNLLDGRFKLHSWNFFILICAIPSMVCAIGHCFLPESPKFLMTVGRNQEALSVFKKVYSMNTGLHPNTFPIKSLIDESQLNLGGKHGGHVTANRNKTQALKEGWQQMMPMFFPPHLFKILLAAVIQSGFMLGVNTIRLWLPQILTAMNDYQALFPDVTASLCTMLEIITPKENSTTVECIVNNVSDFVYMNSMIVAGTCVIGYLLASVIVNKLSKKYTSISLSAVSGIICICIYFSQNSPTAVALAALNITSVGICCNIELTIVVDMFPTSLRTIAVAITLMIGRCGAMLGNLFFPYLLSLGCLPPFLLIGCVIISCSFLSMLLPKTDMKALE